MRLIDPARSPFNELASLLQRLDPQALVASVGAFPQFEQEVARGPNAGSSKAAASWDVVEGRARFSLLLAEKVNADLDARWQAMLKRKQWLRRIRFAIVIAGAATGAATLAAFGLDRPQAAQVASVSTAILAIITAGVNFIGNEESTKRFQALVDLRTTAYALKILRNELDVALAARADVDDFVRLMEKANKMAAELHRGIDQGRA